jgi:hypothetical protein
LATSSGACSRRGRCRLHRGACSAAAWPTRRRCAQREVGQTVAEAYGVHGFDPETFVCIGSGRPIGYPNMVLGVDSHEWEIFEPVDRHRGDALLAIAWLPDAPAGW